MGAVYSGSTPKYTLRLKDSNGVQLDPSNLAQISEVRILIFNAISGDIIGRFYLNTQPDASWKQLITKVIEQGDTRLLMVMTAEMTEAAKGNANKIQVTVTYPDTEAPENKRIEVLQGNFYEIKKAK